MLRRPDRLVDTRRLRRAATLTGVGDGVAGTAFPLLAAAITRDPLAIAGVVAAQYMAWVLVAAISPAPFGATDRRTVAGLVQTGRALVAGVLALVLAATGENIQIVQACAFAFGLGEALTDMSESDGEAPEALASGGAFSRAGMWGLALVGLPLGGLLFELLAPVPFLFDVLAYSMAALFALSVRQRIGPQRYSGGQPEGVSRLRLAVSADTTVATVATTLAVAATSAVAGVLILFVLEDLGLGAPAFGALLAGLAAASAVGGWVAPEVGRWFGLRLCHGLALAGVAVGLYGSSVVADPEQPILAAMALGVSSGSSTLAGVIARARIHLASPKGLTDEALRSFHLLTWSAIPLGALTGGIAARSLEVADVLMGAATATVVAAMVAWSK